MKQNKGQSVAITKFKKEIWAYYRKNRRDFPWRGTASNNSTASPFPITPYEIVISEIMLQQTQASRVVPRFERFIGRFPNWQTLARAATAEVLTEWQGLGYNRRALYLKRIAEAVTASPTKEIPRTYDELRQLPGIGPNTAGSILAFAWNIPHPFIETNIRSVFIHFFFKTKSGSATQKINDKDLFALIEKTLDTKNPREWYYALMDYGAHLKATCANPSRRSAQHVKQSVFKGSNRELRARILREILKKPQTVASLYTTLSQNSVVRKVTIQDIRKNLEALEKEGFISSTKSGAYKIKNNATK